MKKKSDSQPKKVSQILILLFASICLLGVMSGYAVKNEVTQSSFMHFGESYNSKIIIFNGNNEEGEFVIKGRTDRGLPAYFLSNGEMISSQFQGTLQANESIILETISHAQGSQSYFASIELGNGMLAWKVAGNRPNGVHFSSMETTVLNGNGHNVSFSEVTVGQSSGNLETFLALRNTSPFTSTILARLRESSTGSVVGTTSLTHPPDHTSVKPLSDVFNVANGPNYILDLQSTQDSETIPEVSSILKITPNEMAEFPGEEAKVRDEVTIPFIYSPAEIDTTFHILGNSDFMGEISIQAPSLAESITTISGLKTELSVAHLLGNPGHKIGGFATIKKNSGSDFAWTTEIQGEGKFSYSANAELGQRIAFPVANRDFLGASQTALLLKKNVAEAIAITIIFLSESGEVFHFFNHVIEDPVDEVSIIDDLMAFDTAILVLETQDDSDEIAASLLFQAENGAYLDSILDAIPGKVLQGPRTVGQFGSILEAWHNPTVPSCVGSPLDILDILAFIQNNWQCP